MSIKRISINSAVIQESAVREVERKRRKLTNTCFLLWFHITLLFSGVAGEGEVCGKQAGILRKHKFQSRGGMEFTHMELHFRIKSQMCIFKGKKTNNSQTIVKLHREYLSYYFLTGNSFYCNFHWNTTDNSFPLSEPSSSRVRENHNVAPASYVMAT